MKENFRSSLARVLRHEGGFVHHPKDPGGATNKGITLGTYRRFLNPMGTIADLKKITAADIEKVYKEQYWDEVAGDLLPSGIDYAVFDFAVNSGPSRAIRHLQLALDVIVDEKIGPKTLAAANKRDKAETINRICNTRLVFKKKLKGWATFGKGWSRRVADVRSYALQLAKDEQEAPRAPIPKPIDKPAPVKPNRSMWAVLIDAILKMFGRSK